MDFLCIIHTHDPIRKDTVSICLYFIATKQIGTSKNVILGKGKDIKIWTCSLFLVCTICYNFILSAPNMYISKLTDGMKGFGLLLYR